MLRFLFAGLLLAAVGCSGGGNPSGEGPKTYRIAVIPKGTSHDFWKSVHYGAEKAAKELGHVEIIWQGTADETDKEGQIKIVDAFVGQKVDGIVLAPIDRDGLMAPVRRAAGRKIPVVIFDSGLRDHAGVVSHVATDNARGGRMAGEHMAKLLGGKGGVVLLQYQAGSESTEQRETAFLEAIAEHPGITVVDKSQRVNSDASEALKISTNLLRTHAGKVDGVFTVCEPNNKGMLQALENERLAGDVTFVAFDPDPRMIEGLRNGTVDGVVLQDPVNMGYLAIKAMVSHLKGEEVEPRIDTGVHLATKENMDEPRMRELLNPQQYGKE
jgi:ribose transport system substrate-binding protein